ncbi:hypothetical protein QE152_g37283 [Popillia japonica]|uniref:Uncharacterized protein n=1 Tax=Popillia japonica TaxID=7064 RepID=A0AAW1IB25_POPJA
MDCYQTIKSERYTNHYRFRKIPVHGLRKQQKESGEEPTPSTSLEKKPESDVESTSNTHLRLLLWRFRIRNGRDQEIRGGHQRRGKSPHK